MNAHKFGCLVVLAVALGCGKKPAKKRDADQTPGGAPVAAPGTSPSPGSDGSSVVKVDPLALIGYNKPREAALAAIAPYDGKMVEVTGKVYWLATWANDKTNAYITLKGATDNVLDILGCVTTDPTPWLTLRPGQQATIVGRFEILGKSSRGMLMDSRVTAVSGKAPDSIPVTQHVDALIADPERQKREATHDTVHIYEFTATVVGSRMDGSNPVWDLGTHKGVKLSARFPSSLAKPVPPVKPGQQVRFLGQSRWFKESDSSKFQLTDCLPIDPKP